MKIEPRHMAEINPSDHRLDQWIWGFPKISGPFKKDENIFGSILATCALRDPPQAITACHSSDRASSGWTTSDTVRSINKLAGWNHQIFWIIRIICQHGEGGEVVWMLGQPFGGNHPGHFSEARGMSAKVLGAKLCGYLCTC